MKISELLQEDSRQQLNEIAPAALLIPGAIAVGRASAPAIARFFSGLASRFGAQTAQEVAKKAGYAGSAAAAAGIAKVATDEKSTDAPALSTQDIDSAITAAQQKAQQAGMSMAPGFAAASALANAAIDRVTGTTPRPGAAADAPVEQPALARAGTMTTDREDVALGASQTAFAAQQDRDLAAQQLAAQRATGASELDRFNRQGRANQLQQAETTAQKRAEAAARAELERRQAEAEQGLSTAINRNDQESMAGYKDELARIQQLNLALAKRVGGEQAAERNEAAGQAAIDQQYQIQQAQRQASQDAAEFQTDQEEGALKRADIKAGEQARRAQQALATAGSMTTDREEMQRGASDTAYAARLDREQAELKKRNDAAAMAGNQQSQAMRAQSDAVEAGDRDSMAGYNYELARLRNLAGSTQADGTAGEAAARRNAEREASEIETDQLIGRAAQQAELKKRNDDAAMAGFADSTRARQQSQPAVSTAVGDVARPGGGTAPPPAVPGAVPGAGTAAPTSGTGTAAPPAAGTAAPPAAGTAAPPASGTAASAPPYTGYETAFVPTPPSPAPVPPPPPPAAAPLPSSTTVKAGSTLSQIAQNANTTVAALMAANPNIRNPDAIQAGQKINLPSPSERTGGSVYAGGIGTAAETQAGVESGKYLDYMAAQKAVAAAPVPAPPTGGSQVTADTWRSDTTRESLDRLRVLSGLKTQV